MFVREISIIRGLEDVNGGDYPQHGCLLFVILYIFLKIRLEERVRGDIVGAALWGRISYSPA